MDNQLMSMTDELRREILTQCFEVNFVIADLRNNISTTDGSHERYSNARSALISVVTLASIYPKFFDAVETRYKKVLSRKWKNPTSRSVYKMNAELVSLWIHITRTLTDVKIIE